MSAYAEIESDCATFCAQCGKQTGLDEVGLLRPEEELGFCGDACMVVYVRERWMSGGTS